MTPKALRSGLIFGLAALALAACDRELILSGERLTLDATRPSAGAPAPIALPAAVARADWTHKAANAAHVMPHAALGAAPRLAFAQTIGQAESRRHRITADPVVAGGRIFTVDSRARVQATGLGGQPIWSTTLVPGRDGIDDASGAGLAAAGDRLYVSTAFGEVVALDAATGRLVWRHDLGAAAAGAPTVDGGTVYVVARDATAWALDTATGRVRWTAQGTPSDAGVAGGAAPAVAGDTVVLPFASRELRGLLKAGGTELWTTTVAGTRVGAVYASITDITGDPVILGDTIYAGSPSGRTNAVALGSGETRWSAEVGAMSPVTVAGGSVFTVSDLARLTRIDAATGQVIWSRDLPFFERPFPRRRKAVFEHYGPVLAGGRLWVASSDGLLRGFSPESGALVTSVEIPSGAATNPVVAGGTLYVVSQAGQLLAFR